MPKVIALIAGVALAALAVIGTLMFVVPPQSGVDAGQDPQPSSSRSLTVRGTVLVRGSPQDFEVDGWACATTGGFKDIRAGAQVVITDASATTIGVGNLSAGWGTAAGDPRVGCEFPFVITDVPAGHQFYGIEVSHRGRLQYAADQLASPLHLELGN